MATAVHQPRSEPVPPSGEKAEQAKKLPKADENSKGAGVPRIERREHVRPGSRVVTSGTVRDALREVGRGRREKRLDGVQN